MKSIGEYDYPKQYILNEEQGTKIYKVIGVDEGAEEIDEYQFKVVSTITEKEDGNEKYSLIQHEDQRIGWINLKNSIQIYRFKAVNSRFIRDDFIANEINDKLDIVKDFKTHFTGKILTVKSEIEYEGERLLGVFIKDKFFGFHNKKYFEELIECKVEIPEDKVSQKLLYKVSKMNEPYTEEVIFSSPCLVSVFKESNIGRLQANSKEFYWTSLDGLEDYTAELKSSAADKDREQMEIDDLFYAVNKERKHSKELVKTVLSAKSYLKSKKAKEKDQKIKTLQNSFKNTVSQNQLLKDEILELKRENHKLQNDVKLSNNRLEQQKDYNQRLEAQRDKYKARMELVEEKLKKLTKK